MPKSCPNGHKFVKILKKWETTVPAGSFDNTILCHSKEVMVCQKCGKRVEP